MFFFVYFKGCADFLDADGCQEVVDNCRKTCDKCNGVPMTATTIQATQPTYFDELCKLLYYSITILY